MIVTTLRQCSLCAKDEVPLRAQPLERPAHNRSHPFTRRSLTAWTCLIVYCDTMPGPPGNCSTSAQLSDEQLDREFDIGHRSLRATFHHIIRNLEVWSSLMAGECVSAHDDRTMPGMVHRLESAAQRFANISRQIADRNAWDETWLDLLDDPPREKTYGGAIAHVITHGMHHRAQVLYLLRMSGVSHAIEGDVLSWESQSHCK